MWNGASHLCSQMTLFCKLASRRTRVTIWFKRSKKLFDYYHLCSFSFVLAHVVKMHVWAGHTFNTIPYGYPGNHVAVQHKMLKSATLSVKFYQILSNSTNSIKAGVLYRFFKKSWLSSLVRKIGGEIEKAAGRLP